MAQIPHAPYIRLPYTSCLPSYPALASQLLPSSLAAIPLRHSPSIPRTPFGPSSLTASRLSTPDNLPRSSSFPALPHSFLASDPLSLTSMPRIPKLLGLNSLPVSGSDFHTALYYSITRTSASLALTPTSLLALKNGGNVL